MCRRSASQDAKSGEAVKALYRQRRTPAVTAENEVHASSASTQLTAYKRAQGQIEFRTDLPKTNVGKILRRELRDKA